MTDEFKKLGFSSILGINTLYSRRRAFSVGAIGLGRGISNWKQSFLLSNLLSCLGVVCSIERKAGTGSKYLNYGEQGKKAYLQYNKINGNIIEPFYKHELNAVSSRQNTPAPHMYVYMYNPGTTSER